MRGGKRHQKKPKKQKNYKKKNNNYPIVSRKSFTEEAAEANCYSKEDKVYHKEQSLPSREEPDKNHLKENLPPLRVL